VVVAAPMKAAAADPVVELRGITKWYGTRLAIDGLDLGVQAGEVVGLLGPNGAGKTTAVKILLGLVRRSSGSGRLLGLPLGDPQARRSVGYLPELFRHPPWLTGREVLAYHAELAEVFPGRRRESIDAALANADLASRGEDLVGGYSKGMQQRLGIAVAMLGQPALIVLDEPATGLDPIGRHELRGMIRGLREQGTAILLNSHQLSEVEQVCDRVTILHAGRVLADGPLDDLLEPGGVRIRATGLTHAAVAAVQRFGPVQRVGDQIWMPQAPEDAVPTIVRTLIENRADVHLVEPIQSSLEDRFRQLLTGEA
jgi:ABC-2 type transport system ATP-binding protein